MATKEFITDRISKAKEQITKKENLISKMKERISKNTEKLQMLGFTEIPENYYNIDRNNPNREKAIDLAYSIENAEDSIENAERDLKELNTRLQKYEAELQTIIEKENSRNVKVIIDFLQMWKVNTFKFYQDKLPKYLEARNEFWKKEKELCHWYNTTPNKSHDDIEKNRKEHQTLERNFQSEWGWLRMYVTTSDKLNEAELLKDLDAEADRKYDFIIERTNHIVGEITDASNLYIGSKSDLNGYIIGTKGIAKVQTIGAGGYNIQCYHFRTLINRM